MTADPWETQVDAFWATADDTQPDQVLHDVRALVATRPDDDPAAVFELASAYDFLGQEGDAVPLYRAALDAGLTGVRRPRAVIQLASSLRNLGDAAAAVVLLETSFEDPDTEPGRQAFLALALRDCGRHDEALQVALTALAPTLLRYRRSVLAYAEELSAPR